MSEARAELGQRMQAAREKRGLSAQKAADQLHLDGWVVEALEGGNYERVGPTVYAKGHLKRYAELLGLPVAEVLAGFDGAPTVLEPQTQPASNPLLPSFASGREPPWPWIAGVTVAVLMVVGIFFWRPWHSRTASTTAAVPVAGAPAANTLAMPGAPGSGGVAGPQAATTAAGGAQSTSPVVASPGPAAQSSADTRAASGRARLRLFFLGDSWVDVHDALGQRLFAGTGHVNNVRSMSGEAPFRIYLKSANVIRLEINNHVVAIGPQYVVDNIAHFEAGADGILRRDLRAASAAGTRQPAATPAASAGSRPHG